MPSTTTFTWEVKSQRAQTGDIGDISSVQEVRHIRRIDGQPINPYEDPYTMENEGAISRRGDLAFPGGGGSRTWQNYLRYRGYTIESLPGAAGAMMTHTWDTYYAMVVRPGPLAYYHLPANVEDSSISRSTRIYRTAWTVNPPAASSASADIGGTALMGGQDGMAFNVGQTRIRLRFMQDSTVASILSTSTRLSNYTNYTNNATFLNCPAYSLICEGVSVNWVKHEFYEIAFDFLYDEWYHHEQVPDLSSDGRPARTAAGNLSVVKWKRLPRNAVDFNNIYGGDTNLKAIVEQGYEP